MADEIAGGDVRDAEEGAEAAGVGAFSDAGAAEEHPLHVPLLERRRVRRESRRRGGDALYEAGYGRHWKFEERVLLCC